MRQINFLLCLSIAYNQASAFMPLAPTVSSLSMRIQETDTTTVVHHTRTSLNYGNHRSPLPDYAERKSTAENYIRLTQEEEQELLRRTVELRRLTSLEKDMQAQPESASVETAVFAKAAGYGDEIEAYEQAKIEGQQARETLVTRNMGLVHFCIGQIVGKRKGSSTLNSLSKEDLIQEGAIGLARAIDKWNPAIGGRFSTYAVYWIRATMMRCIANSDDMLRVPEYMLRAVTKVNKAANRLGVQNELAETLNSLSTTGLSEASLSKRLAKEAGLTEVQLAEVLKVRTRRYTGGYVTFDTWMQKGKDLHSDVPSSELDFEKGEMSSSIEKDYLYETLSKFLRPREMEALSWRYGLVDETSDGSIAEPRKTVKRDYVAEAEDYLFGSSTKKKVPQQPLTKKGRWGEAMSFNDVGRHMQVSAEYGRRLCHSALDKLRRAAAEGELELALLC